MDEIKINSGYKTPITISDAIEFIEERRYLLPAIQRKFVWSSEQIEVLFDSIMRNYPINSFMLWNVTSDNAKNNYKFYEFLKEYRAYFKDENPYINTKGYKDFFAVIDGQQRLTSLYLGLKGTYAYKMPRKWWKDNEECLPTRKLYLNLTAPLPQDDERKMIYNFGFLTDEEYDNLSKTDSLFPVNDIYLFKSKEDGQDTLEEYIEENGLRDNRFAKSALRKLRKVIFEDKLINYYQEENQDIDTVLDIFIRTNSGGEPLSFSNLLMSITTTYWNRDARKEFDTLVKKVYNSGFIISADLILKCCLVLFNDNIKFQVANFNTATVSVFDSNWDRIKKCIEVTFELLSKWGFNDYSLRAKNAVIPIVYYIYYHNYENEMLKEIRLVDEKKTIRKWLSISLLKGIFGGQSDSVLTGIRKVLKNNLLSPDFPFDLIKKEFAGNDAKSLTLSDELIEGLLKTQKESPSSYPLLSLLYSDLKYEVVHYHMDHLHPASAFWNLSRESFDSDEKFNFYTNTEHWNSILNLQLLSPSTNESKSDEALEDWVKDKDIDLKLHLIPENVSLKFDNFEQFIDKRKELLIEVIKNKIS